MRRRCRAAATLSPATARHGERRTSIAGSRRTQCMQEEGGRGSGTGLAAWSESSLELWPWRGEERGQIGPHLGGSGDGGVAAMSSERTLMSPREGGE
jgi:hypothetical protein